MMNKWVDIIGQESIFFITPDVKRGTCFDDQLPDYHIVCSRYDQLIPVLRKQGAKIFCLEEHKGQTGTLVNNSGKLLEDPLVTGYIQKHSKSIPNIIFFKPSLKLDMLIQKKKYLALGNKANINEEFENKILFHQKIQEILPQETIPSIIGRLEKIDFIDTVEKLGLPFVVQFGHGWAGKTTYFISNNDDYTKLTGKFFQTAVKISKKIEGFTLLNNCCIYQDKILVGKTAVQLNNITELSCNPSVTCGRQWPAENISIKDNKKISEISIKIGKMMKKCGFKGFFGLDFLVEEATGKIFLSEANARLTASSAFYTRLETGLNRIPLLAYHIASFTRRKLPIEQNDDDIRGSQIIFRKSDSQPINLESGKYIIKDGKAEYCGQDYHPEKLSGYEFIFMKSREKAISRGEEVARTETKQEVLESKGQLKEWVLNLLRK